MARLTSADSVRLSSLLGQLLQGDFEERWAISKQLVRWGSSQVLSPLIQWLERFQVGDHEEDPDLLWFVAGILGELQHPRAVDALLQLAQAHPQTEIAAIAITALAKSRDLSLPALAQLLRSPQTRLLAVEALSQLGRASTIPLLLSVVHDPEAQVRAVALEGLTVFHDPEITPILIQALDDPASAVRLAALRGIGSRGRQWPQREALIDRVVLLLEDIHLEVGCQAAIALGRLQSPPALAGLMGLLDRPMMPLPLKVQAIRSLAWSETDDAVSWLGGRLSDWLGREPRLALEAIQILGRLERQSLKQEAVRGLLHTLGQLAEQTPGSGIGREGGREGGNNGKSDWVEVKTAIALALGQLGQPEAFMPLVSLLAEPVTSLRLQVVAALQRLDPQEGQQRLTLYLAELGLQASDLSQSGIQAAPLLQGIQFALGEWRSAENLGTRH